MTHDFPMRGGCWPTPTQELLLRAALTQGEAALESWRKWRADTDIETLDHASRLLLPLLLQNLEAQGIGGSQLTRYRSVSRHAWVQNQLLLDGIGQLILLLEAENIPTLVFRGAALATRYYPEIWARPFNDVNVLVPSQEACRALELLHSKGYQIRFGKTPPSGVAAFVASSVCFLEKSKGEAVALHQYALPTNFTAKAGATFWNAAIALQIGDFSTRTLCAEDQLLLVCARAGRWSQVPPLRWIADATLILRTQHDFDWSRLVAQAKRQRLALPLGAALRYLQHPALGLALPIPVHVLDELAALPNSRAERREFALLSRSSRPLSSKVWLRVRSYSRWNTLNPRWQRPFTFPRYLQYLWGLNSLAHLPFYAIRQVRGHLRKSQ